MTLFARVIRPVAWPVFMAAFRVRVVGAENVPTTGGAILAGNHVSYMDPVLLWEFAPRRPHFMAKSELFHGFLGWMLPRVYAFPVVRGSADRAAITTATKLLQDGELVGIFPEGTRSADGEAGEAHGGVSFIAMRAGVPVVPVAFVGTEKCFRGGRSSCAPHVSRSRSATIDTAAFTEGSRKERMDALTATIMERIAEELDAARSCSAMRVIVAKHAGICYGVERALKLAGEPHRRRRVRTLGPLIHNPQAVAALREQGVEVANTSTKSPADAHHPLAWRRPRRDSRSPRSGG